MNLYPITFRPLPQLGWGCSGFTVQGREHPARRNNIIDNIEE